MAGNGDIGPLRVGGPSPNVATSDHGPCGGCGQPVLQREHSSDGVVKRFDDATHQHCLLVAALAAAFSGALGLGAADRHRLTKAALLHDVGKIQVPTAILNKRAG